MQNKLLYIVLGGMIALIASSMLRIGFMEFVILGIVVAILAFALKSGPSKRRDKDDRPKG